MHPSRQCSADIRLLPDALSNGCRGIQHRNADRYRIVRCGSVTDHRPIEHPERYDEAIVDNYLRLITTCPHLFPSKKTLHLTSRFVSVAKRFSVRFGIEYQTWIAMGLSPGLLLMAGIEPDGP